MPKSRGGKFFIFCLHPNKYVGFITFPALSTAETTSTFDPRVDPWLVLPSDRPSPKLLSLGRVNLTGGPWRTSSSLDCDLASDRRGASLPLLLLEATDPWQLEAEQEQTLEVSLDLFWWWPSLVTNSIFSVGFSQSRIYAKSVLKTDTHNRGVR